jgi:hypothetical protein
MTTTTNWALTSYDYYKLAQCAPQRYKLAYSLSALDRAKLAATAEQQPTYSGGFNTIGQGLGQIGGAMKNTALAPFRMISNAGSSAYRGAQRGVGSLMSGVGQGISSIGNSITNRGNYFQQQGGAQGIGNPMPQQTSSPQVPSVGSSMPQQQRVSTPAPQQAVGSPAAPQTANDELQGFGPDAVRQFMQNKRVGEGSIRQFMQNRNNQDQSGNNPRGSQYAKGFQFTPYGNRLKGFQRMKQIGFTPQMRNMQSQLQ